jgi:uncharacterized protein (DUF433 family)
VEEARHPAPDDIIGVSIDRAASIVGVSVQRLATWERIGLVEPLARARAGSRLIRIYGLSELVELRIVDELTKRGHPIRVVRRIVEAHRSSTIAHPLRELRWATDAGMVFVGFEDGSWVGGRHPTQGVIPDVIDLDEIRASTRDAALRRMGRPGVVEKRSGVLGRKPVFEGTRTPVEAVVAYYRRGVSDAEILEAFPHLTADDLDTARSAVDA